MSLTPTSGATTLQSKPSQAGSVGRTPRMLLKRTIGLMSAVAITAALAACGGSDSSSTATDAGGAPTTGTYGNCDITRKPGSITLTPATPDTLTVETTLPAPGWWNGTTPESIKDGYEYCMAAELANMAGLSKLVIKNVSFDQLVAGHTSDYDIALAEITITAERDKVV